MPYFNPPQNGPKSSSRFSSLNVFKLKPGSGADPVPPLPSKDPSHASLNPPSAFYNKSLFSRSATSLSPSLSPESISGPATPSTPYPSVPGAVFELGKHSNSTLASANGRAAAASPAPSASGGSFKSFGRSGADHLHSPSMDGSTDSSGSCPNASANPNSNFGMYTLNGANSSSYTMAQATAAGVKLKKGVFNLANLAKRNRSRKDLSDTASTSGSASRSASASEHEDATGKAEGDEGISSPWNFQHHIHVDEGYIGLPPSWSTALSQVGFNEDEIAVIHARRRAAASLMSSAKLANSNTAYSTERPASPHTSTVTPPLISASSSTTLLQPVVRSTSLGKGRDALGIYPPSMSSVASSVGDFGTSLAPSPRPPSFSMGSIVSGFKSSLASDSASTKGDGGEGPMREESEQYVPVTGDGPDEGGDQGIGDETFEPCPFDTLSVSSLQTHTSRIEHMSQDQQTPRTPAFPQIQVQRAQSDAGRVASSSLASRVPSPLVHSTSLPTPAPARGYTHSDDSTSSSRSHSLASAGLRPGPLSIQPRTPPRRVYHVANASLDSDDEDNYAEPPPAYASPTIDAWAPRKEKEWLGVVGAPPPPNRPIPPVPMEEIPGEPSGVSGSDSREDQGVSIAENDDDMTGNADDIPGTVDEVMDISSCYSDNVIHGRDAEMDPTQEARLLSSTPPLAIDKRMSKLAMLPPRISFHQEGSLEDWSKSLFNVIGEGKRSSVLMRPSSGDAANMKEGRSTIWSMSPLSMTSEGGGASGMASNSSSPEIGLPRPPDASFGAGLALGPHATRTIDSVEAGGEQDQGGGDEAHEMRDGPDDAGEQVAEVDTTTAGEVKVVDESPIAPSSRHPPDLSPGPNVPSLEDLDPPKSTPRASIDSLPPTPPPKPEAEPKPKPKPRPKSKPTPLALPSATTLTPPRTNIITGISGKSPVNSLFAAKPQPLPIPISPSQIRAQLRPAPPKPPQQPPTLPLPPLKRALSQPNLQPPSPPQSQVPPLPSPKVALKHDPIVSHTPPSGSRPNSSQTLLPVRVNSGGRDSDLSTITVTPATIATAKTEVVRTAVASVVDSDAVSLASMQEGGGSPRTQEHGEALDDAMISETSSVSLDGSQSKWPAPPPPPVEIETDLTPRRLSRFRTTSLGRVGQLLASTVASPISIHFSHGSSDTTSSSTSEDISLPTPKAVNGLSPFTAPKTRSSLAAEAIMITSVTDTFGGVYVESEDEESRAHSHPPEISLSESHASIPPSTHPLLAQLQPYITPRNPASYFTELVEIAEGESGSVFAARVAPSFAGTRPHEGQESTERLIPPGTSHVAIKRIPLPPLAFSPSLSDDSPVNNKLVSVLHELSLLRNLDHEHLLLLDAVYVGSSSIQDEDTGSASAMDTSLWIRMELMERSLADVIGLVAEGLALQERLVGRFASDILHGLDYLQRQHIAHRDVRSDNLLVSATGVVKLADFSNAIRVDRNSPTVSGAVGVIYWQAPEMRAGPYNALKVDTWSLGATVWELAETVPPFSMPASPSTEVSFAIQTARHVGSQWPPLTHPEHYSRAFHEFLRLCGRESETRPGPGELLNTSFVRNACGRAVILQLLSQCRAIEEAMVASADEP